MERGGVQVQGATQWGPGPPQDGYITAHQGSSSSGSPPVSLDTPQEQTTNLTSPVPSPYPEHPQPPPTHPVQGKCYSSI